MPQPNSSVAPLASAHLRASALSHSLAYTDVKESDEHAGMAGEYEDAMDDLDEDPMEEDA